MLNTDGFEKTAFSQVNNCPARKVLPNGNVQLMDDANPDAVIELTPGGWNALCDSITEGQWPKFSA